MTPPFEKRESVFAVGFRSVRANAVPMAVLWLMAVALVVVYYRIPGAADLLEPLRRWQDAHEIWGSVLSRAVFCGLLPGVFILTGRAPRPRRPVATILAQTVWCGAWGVWYVFFYRDLAQMFGDGSDLATLVKKTVVDMFVWSALAMIPLYAVFCHWLGHGLSWTRARDHWPRRFVRDLVLPNLIVNWCIWIPVMMAVYAFPRALQIQLVGLAGAFWSLVLLNIGSRDKGGE